MLCFLTRSEGRCYRPNSSRISGISLKFGGMMHSNMKQIAMLGHFSACSVELWNFQNRLGPGLRDDFSALTLWEFQQSAWNLVGWCTVTWSRSPLKVVMLGQFLCIPRNFDIFHDSLGAGRWNWGNHITTWNLVAWCSLPWSGSLYERPHLANARIFLSRTAEGVVVLWTSCWLLYSFVL